MSQGSKYLIHAAHVLDGTSDAPIADGCVLIEDERIAFVGKRGEAPDAADAELIDGTGLTVMPGLIDGHNCINGNPRCVGVLRGYLQHGVRTVASFHGNWPGQPPAVLLRDAIEGGAARGCARLIAGYVVNCTNGHNHGRTADGPWEVRRAVREMVQQGADFIKTAASGGFWGTGESASSPNYTVEELTALVDEAHAWGVPVGAHVHTQPGLDRAIEAGLDLIYHGCFIDRSAVDKMAQHGTWYLPTLKVTTERNISAWPDRPWMKKEMAAATQTHRDGVRQAIQAGCRVGVGSDGPGSPRAWAPGESSVFEFAELVRCGMTPMQAIAAGTSRVAEAYRVGDRVGSLAPGKEADLLCIEGEPHEDIEQLQDQQRIAMVFQKGRIEYVGERYKCHYATRDPPHASYVPGLT